MRAEPGSADHIILTVPASSEYAKTVRITAAALVSRMDISIDDLDDVRMAVEEAFIYACEADPETGEVTLHFFLGPDALRVEVPVGAGARAWDEEAERRSALATFILEGVCDTYEMSSDDSGAWLRVSKRFGTVDANAG